MSIFNRGYTDAQVEALIEANTALIAVNKHLTNAVDTLLLGLTRPPLKVPETPMGTETKPTTRKKSTRRFP